MQNNVEVKERYNLTGLLLHMNQNYKKAGQKDFTMGDIQGYVRRGWIPNYLGGDLIRCELISNVKFYSLYKRDY